ncbi:biotin/lipoyl-containing protein, partial [Corynebacterium matruchotii]|uniref:biotin/lipoyl-containing protein n=1 Tax=Corynebacterium matruchotii TaxID=43768 RepID=UPI00361E69BD
MAHSVVMPELGESVTEGTITQWLKAVGDTVSVDEPLLEVSTDKVDTEVPSPVAGVLLEIRAEEDDTIEVGDVIAIIGDTGEAPATTPAAPTAPAEPEPAPAAAAPATPAAPAAPATSGAVDVVMPELGESVTEGVITQWLKSVGDTVAVDEALLEVSTDKVDTEVPSPIAGTIVEILFEEDDTVEVGDVIARIGDKNAAPAPAAPAPTPEPQPEPTPAPAA